MKPLPKEKIDALDTRRGTHILPKLPKKGKGAVSSKAKKARKTRKTHAEEQKTEDRVAEKPVQEGSLAVVPGGVKVAKEPVADGTSRVPAENADAGIPKRRPWFRRLFTKEKKGVEEQAESIIEKMRKPPEQKRRKKLHRKSLQEYLEKAGYDIEAKKVKRGALIAVIATFALATVWVALYYPLRFEIDILRIILFLAGIWTVGLIAAMLCVMGCIFFFLDYRIYVRTQELEDVLPDYLQLASANIAAGMPIDRALWYSIRPNFGVLAKEMEEVAKATMSGEDLETSLIAFTKRYDSKLLKRSISILIEGLHSGGQLADLLNKIALNIDELKIMRKEMAANVTTYAIFIIAAAIVIAPALFALATQLLIIITGITASLDLSSTSQLFSMGAVDPDVIANFTFFSYAMLCVSAAFGALIVSIIKKGTVVDGIKGIPVYAFMAIVIYKVSSIFLGAIFGSII